jgi:hypothetical protein
VLSVVETLKGRPLEVEITLSWTSEVHDQRITGLGSDYILFLALTENGNYEAAVYGRSFWPIRQMVGPWVEICEVIDYQYPLTYVTLPDALEVELKSLRETKCGELLPATSDVGVLRVPAILTAIDLGGI